MNDFPLKSHKGRLRIVLILFFVYGIFNLIFVSYEIYDFYQVWSGPNFFNSYTTLGRTSPFAIMGMLVLGFISLLLKIFFIIWFHRAYFNLGLRTKTEMHTSWAIWGWFIPIYWWFICYSIIVEIWNKKQLYREDESKVRVPNALLVYWLLFVLSSAMTSISILFLYLPIGLDIYLGSIGVSIASRIFAIASAFLAIYIYKGIGKFEEEFHQEQMKSNQISEHLIEW